jgi:hypothetical protein
LGKYNKRLPNEYSNKWIIDKKTGEIKRYSKKAYPNRKFYSFSEAIRVRDIYFDKYSRKENGKTKWYWILKGGVLNGKSKNNTLSTIVG